MTELELLQEISDHLQVIHYYLAGFAGIFIAASIDYLIRRELK